MKIEKKAPVLTPSRFVPLDMLVDFPDMGQRPLDKDHVTSLQDSSRANGLAVPLITWDGGTEYPNMKLKGKEVPSCFLVAGLHRRAALRRLAKEDADAFAKKFPNGIPVVVASGSLKDMLTLQLRENLDRKDPTTEEILPKILRLRDEFKMKGKQIATAVGRSPSYVSSLFDIETQLGKSGLKEVLEGGVAIRDALKAAEEVKKAKKKGEDVDVDATVAKAKGKTAARAASGAEREPKRTSIKKVWDRFKALPSMDDSTLLEILRKGVSYVVGERDALPRELRKDAAKASATEKE